MRRLHLIVRKRLQSAEDPRSAHKKEPVIRLAAFLSIALLVISAALVFVALLQYARLTHDFLPMSAIENAIQEPIPPTVFTDRSGQNKLLAVRSLEAPNKSADNTSRHYPNFTDYSPALIRILINAEQPNFAADSGLPFDVARPLSPKPQRISERLLTILFEDFASEPTRKGNPSFSENLERALRLRMQGSQVLTAFPREKIAVAYLENGYFGQRAIGISAALFTYLDKSIADADLADAVLMSAILEKPALNPIDSHGAMRDVYLEKIDTLRQAQILSDEEADRLRSTGFTIFEPPQLDRSVPDNPILKKALQTAVDSVGQERVDRGGLTVQTTLDAPLQAYLECLAGIIPEENRPEPQTNPNDPEGNEESDTNITDIIPVPNPLTIAAKQCPFPAPRTITDELETGLINVPAGKDEPSDKPNETPMINDAEESPEKALIRERLAASEISAFILDVKTGTALAAVQVTTNDHGARIAESRFRPYAPGTAIAPFIALAAYGNGFAPGSGVWDLPSAQPELVPAEAFVLGQRELGPIRLRTAINQDRRAPLVAITREIGSATIQRTLTEFGLSDGNGLPPEKLLFDGGYVTADTLANAYAAFAGSGQITGTYLNRQDSLPRPRTILYGYRLETSQPTVLQPREKLRLVDESLAYLVNHTLSNEEINVKLLNRPVALKFGTTLSGNGLWLIGYTPERVITLHLANPNLSETDLEELSLELFRALAEKTHQNVPESDWTIPHDLTTVTVCADSGDLATADCPNVVSEIYLTGNEPIHRDSLHQTITVNRVNRLPATARTPLENRLEKKVMNLPAFAQNWAHANRIETVPNEFDPIGRDKNAVVTVYEPQPYAQFVIDTTPKIEIKAEIEMGKRPRAEQTASEIQQVIVQYGAGLDPEGWIKLNEIETLSDGRWSLAELDLRNIEPGVVTVRVIVVTTDQHAYFNDTFITILGNSSSTNK